MRGTPRCSVPYSIVPIVAVSTMLPALRATKSSPTPSPPNSSSGGTRLSEQVIIVAHGVCPFATLSRCFKRSTAQSWGALTYLSLPAFSFANASSAVTFVVAAPAAKERRTAKKLTATTPAADRERNVRRPTINLSHSTHIDWPLCSCSITPGRPVVSGSNRTAEANCIPEIRQKLHKTKSNGWLATRVGALLLAHRPMKL